jgi:transcriptional regulator with XRE-family HTH domain
MRFRKEVTPDAVRGFRERRGWTLEEMADEVWASPAEVAAWEAGTVRVPSGTARRMREIAARSRRDADELMPGPRQLPRCTWADVNAPGLHEILFHTPHEAESNPLVQQHLETCEECQRVQRFGHFARTLPPVPARGVDDPAEELGYGLDSLPALGLIALLSLGGFAVFLLLRFLASLLPGDPDFPEIADVWVEAVVFFWVTERVGKFAGELLEGRPYATSLLSSVAGMLVALLAWKLRTPEADLTDPLVLSVCAVVTVLTGSLYGWIRNGGGGSGPDAAEPAVAASAAVPRLGEGAPPAVLDGVVERRPAERAVAPRRDGA